MDKKIEETISNICDYINADIKQSLDNKSYILQEETIDMIKALAGLVSVKSTFMVK